MADVKPPTSRNIIDDLANARVADTRCGILQILEVMSDDDGAALILAIDNPQVSVIDIATILRSHGYKASDKMVYRHRNRSRNGCSCPK